MNTTHQNASERGTTPKPVAPSEVALLDHFAGLAMQTLLRIGSTEISEHEAHDGSPFDYPDSPFYFGDWEPSADPRRVRGVDSLANDAYDVGMAMLRARRELLAETGPSEVTG